MTADEARAWLLRKLDGHGNCRVDDCRGLAVEVAELLNRIDKLTAERNEKSAEVRSLAAGAMTDAQTIDKLTHERDEARERLMMTEIASAKQSDRQASLVRAAEEKADEQRELADRGWEEAGRLREKLGL